MDKNLELLLLKKNYLVYDLQNKEENNASKKEIAAVLDSYASLGFTLDVLSIKKISKLTSKELTLFYNETFSLLSSFVGNSVKHIVFYKDFPNMKHVTDEEYWIRAILHYLTADADDYGFFSDDIKDFKRINTINKNSKKLHIISSTEGNEILSKYFTQLLEQKTAIPYMEFENMKVFIKDNPSSINPSSIPFHENLGSYVSLLIENNMFDYDHLSFVKTVTDILRIYTFISKGTSLLEGKIKFKSLPRKYRLVFIRKLDEIALNNTNICEDLHRHEFYWKKALEKLHIREYQQFDTINKYVKQFRDDTFDTYYRNLERHKNDQDEYLRLLRKRPGDFARKIDAILRNENYDVNKSLDAFEKIAPNISTTILLQLWQYYKNRLPQEDYRIIGFNKTYTKIYLEVEDTRKEVSKDIALKMLKIIESTLESIYSKYERIENVYVSESMKNYALPSNQRNASSQTKTLTYGTRIPLKEKGKNFLRLFTHWKNMPREDEKKDDYFYRVDIDLSIELLSEDFQTIGNLSWHNMEGGRDFNSYHSGDIVTAPEGASEFIELDYKKARKYYRYVIVNNVVFTGQQFYQIPECFSGVMFIDKKSKKGDIFQADKVEHKFSLTQKGSNHNVSYVLDLKTMELIWVDSPLMGACFNVVASQTLNRLIVLIKDLEKIRMNFYDFLMLHKSHLSFVKTKEEANFIVSDEEDADLKPYDIETISSKWL